MTKLEHLITAPSASAGAQGIPAIGSGAASLLAKSQPRRYFLCWPKSSMACDILDVWVATPRSQAYVLVTLTPTI